MRLWLSKRTRGRIAQELREAESARYRAREHQARVGDRAPEVARLVQQLARHRAAGRLTDRIQAAAAVNVIEQLSKYSRDLRDEADRTRDNR